MLLQWLSTGIILGLYVRLQETIATALSALLAEPFALGMALIAAVLAIGAAGVHARIRDRVLMVALAVIGGITAWMMASHWRWPH